MTTLSDVSDIISKNTDELLAITVTVATMGGYYAGIDVPTEPMLLIFGFYFGKKVA